MTHYAGWLVTICITTGLCPRPTPWPWHHPAPHVPAWSLPAAAAAQYLLGPQQVTLYSIYSSKLEFRFLWLWCFVVIYLNQCQWRIDVIYGLICKILIQCSNFFDFILYECLNVYSLNPSLSLKSQYQGRCHNQTISNFAQTIIAYFRLLDVMGHFIPCF